MKEIAKHPQQRIRWWIRKQFNLPITDSRFLAMTPEQIELEWENYKLDNPKLFPEDSYSDPEYNEWEKEQSKTDEQIEDNWEEIELGAEGEDD